MKTQGLLTRLLFAALLGVWGAVGYQVYRSAFASNSERADATPPALPARNGPYTYKPDVDDPFRMAAPPRFKLRKPPEVTPWTPPPVKVTGILSGRGGMTAILEGPGGDISFLGEGDTTSGVKILKIREGLVEYFYRKEKKEWTIDGRE